MKSSNERTMRLAASCTLLPVYDWRFCETQTRRKPSLIRGIHIYSMWCAKCTWTHHQHIFSHKYDMCLWVVRDWNSTLNGVLSCSFIRIQPNCMEQTKRYHVGIYANYVSLIGLTSMYRLCSCYGSCIEVAPAQWEAVYTQMTHLRLNIELKWAKLDFRRS